MTISLSSETGRASAQGRYRKRPLGITPIRAVLRSGARTLHRLAHKVSARSDGDRYMGPSAKGKARALVRAPPTCEAGGRLGASRLHSSRTNQEPYHAPRALAELFSRAAGSTPTVKYHQIEAFYQVMLTGSISKAARNLGRTQPAVSMTICTLEEQLSTTLFDRHAGRIVPRAEAHVLFEQVSLVMQQLNDIRHRFGRLDSIAVPRISIISSSNVGMNLIPNAVADIASSGQELRLMNGSAASIVSEMENQKHDVAVTDEGASVIPLDSPLFEAEVFHIPIYAIFQRGLLEERSSAVTIDALAGHQICTLYKENRTARDIKSKLGSAQVEFSSFFPMACFAITNGRVAIADFITCGAIRALTSQTLPYEFLPISDAMPSPYYLLRPRYRTRSKMADRCHEAIRFALAAHQLENGASETLIQA